MRVLPALVTTLVLLAPAIGGPISSARDANSQCATTCTASSKFQYARGTTYEFDYLAETSTSMEDASEDTARLSISATALVHVISDCDMVLQLRDVSVKESDPNSKSMRSAPDSSRAAALLQRQPLRFSFQDGVVEELCLSGEEELWALNVKRGVLSAFQNSMSRLDSDETVTEVDVAGRCPSQYQVEDKGWYSTTVKRSKNLLACTGRHDYQTAVTATPYHVESPVQSLPLMKSSHECQQTVNQHGILSSATCTEIHQFRPFSREASGAVTKVSQSLQYKTESRSPIRVQPVSQRVSLMFEHANKEEITRKAQQEAEEVLRQLCRDTQTDIRPDTPRLFSSLVSTMRRVDTSGLKALYAQLEQNTLCANNIRTMKFFVDALPMAGTEGSVTMMTQMLMSNDITGLEADMWLTSLALIQEPSIVMLEQVKSVLTSKTLGQKALLPVSTMVNNFCQRQPQCSTEPSVQAIMTSFEDVIGSFCYVNKKNMDQVLMGLRAIGNAGHVSSSASVLNKCLKRSKNPMEIRVSAAQAFRRLPCDADRSTVTFIMEDSQEDSELRIASYLALMTCPDDVTLQRVQLLLESEQDQQMGSFVWSHLTNLQETSSPHKQAVRQLLTNVQLPASFDLGHLQFSRNYEGSAFLKRLNSGATAESNLVWSSSSSLPRSLAANLTVDLFGRSLNLMDFGLRAEGLEYLLETMLGPYGYFGQSGKDKKGDRQLDEVKGSLYLRMLGNEVTFQRFQGLDSFSSATSFNLLDFLIKLSKDHHVSMTHSTEFLDTELTVPTSCGWPLTLTVKGTASMDLKASGKVDLRKVSATPRSLQIDGEIRPSGAIRISGQMAVDGHVSRAALHVTGTMHSSSALTARVNLDRGRVLSVELDVPEEKMDILDISSEFSIVHNKVEKKQKMITENRQTVKLCTGQAASRITGLELCGDLQYPNASARASGPYFPLTGPTSVSVALYKRDSHSGYKLLAKRVENKKKTMAQLSFNTPGSKVDRSLTFDLILNHEDKQLQVSAASPWKKAEFKGAITNTNKLVGVTGSFVTDDVNVYALTTEVKMDQSKNGVTYTPLLEIRRPDMDSVALTGMVSVETKSASVLLTLNGVTAQPWTLKSALTNTKKEVSLTGSIAKGDKLQYSLRVGSQMSIANSKKSVKIQVNPFLSVKSPKRELVSFSGSALYAQDKVLKADFIFSLLRYKPLTAQMTVTKSARKNAVRYISKVNLKSAVVSSSVSGMVDVKKGRLINSRVTVSYSLPRMSLREKLVFLAKISDRSTKAYNKYTVRSSVDSKSFPDYNTAIKLNLDHKKKLSSAELEVRYGQNPKDKTKQVSVSATVARKIKNLRNVDLSYKMSVEAPQQALDVQLRGKHVHNPSNLDSNVVLTCGKGRDWSGGLSLKDKSNKLTKLSGELALKAPGSSFSLKSDLTQASKKVWQHGVDVTAGGSKHSLKTVYRSQGGSAHELSSTADLAGLQPVTVTGQANLDLHDLQLTTSVRHGETIYGVSGTHKLAKSRNGKWSLEVTVPSRQVTVNANAGKVKGNYEGSVAVAWDANNDKNAKVVLEGLVGGKSSKDLSSYKGRVSLSTPLEGYSTVFASLGLDSSSSQHQLSTKLVLGHKKKVITSSLTVATPFTLRDIDLAFKAETPFRRYGSMGVSLTHKLNSSLSTKLTVSLQKDQYQVSLTAANRGTDRSRDLEAQLNLQSSLRRSSLKSLSVSATHKDDGRRYGNQVEVKVNNQAYSYLMNMKVDTGSNTGDLTLTWPKEQLKTTWSHSHSPRDLHTSLTSGWAASQRVQLDVTGSVAPGSLSGSLALTTPWTAARDWRAQVATQYGAGKVHSSASVKNDNRDAFTHNLILTADVSKADMDFSMTSPWTAPISSKVNAKYESFPKSMNAEFSWEPRKKVTAEGSLVANNWDDLDISMRVTTPVRAMRTVAAQVSSRVEGSEVISQVNMDLGMHKNVILTTHLQRDASGVRVKLTTPWDDLRVLDTGVDMNVQSAAGNVKVDFKAVPLIGQYEATATWNAEDDLNARLRLDTPRDDFPYLQIVVTSKDKRSVRQSRVELEYSPRQTYSLESTYSFDLPVVLDINVATPLKGYESMSAAFRHNLRDTAMDASVQVIYTNDQTVKATAMMDWSRGLDSSLTVTTPFSGWEKSSATLRHKGDLNDFNSLADVRLGGQGVTGSLKFLNKMKTDAQLTVSTPWAGWEKIEATISRKGDLRNLRGTASLACSEQKMEANVMTKWNSRKARLVASLTTPFSQDLKLHVEQNAALQTEASLSYGRQYSLDTASSLTINSREVSASTNIKYRAGGPRRLLTASVAKVGSLQDLALTASASLDNQQVSLTAELHTLQDVKAALALTTPFSQFERMGGSFSHTGDLSRMTAEANIEYMTDRNINGQVELTFPSLDQISFRGTLTSPLGGLERSAVFLSHTRGAKMCTGSFSLDSTLGDFGGLDASYQKTGHSNNMKAEAHVTYNSQSLLDAGLSHKLTSSRLLSSLRVTIPVLPELNLDVNHHGDLRRFTTKASASAGGDKVSSSTQWSLSDDSLDLTQTLGSVLESQANSATIALSRVGPLNDLSLQLSGNLNANKAKVIAKLATVRDISASLEVESPVEGYHQMGASFQKTGDSTDLSVTAAANLERHKIEAVSKFTQEKDIKGSIDITTPFPGYQQMGGAFSYDGENAMISGNMQTEKIEATGRLVNVITTEGDVGITTPFKGYSQMGAAFSYDGENAMISGNLENTKIEATGRLVNAITTEGNIGITTPFKGYSQMGAAFSYDGENAMISGNLENTKIEATGRLVNVDTTEGNVGITTPFKGYSQMGAAFSYDGENAMISGNLENTKIEATGRLVNADTTEGNVGITTPFEGYRQMGAAFNFGGENAKISGNLQNDKIEATGRFVNADITEGNVGITTPFEGYRQMEAAFSYNGQNAKVSTNLENSKVEATGRYVNADTIEGDVGITTPFEGYRQMGAAFRCDGENAKISGNLEKEKMEATSRFVNGDMLEGSVGVTTPFEGYRQLGASFHSGSTSVTASAHLQKAQVQATARYDATEDLMGSLEVTTPFAGYSQLGGQFRITGDAPAVTVVTSARVESRKVELTAKLSQGQDLSGSVDLTTPFRRFSSMGASFGLTGDLPALQRGGEVTALLKAYLLQDQLTATAALSSAQGLAGTLTINTPVQGFRQVGASFKHTGGFNNFQTEGQVVYKDGQDISGKVSFYKYRLESVESSAELRTPFTNWEMTRVTYKHAGNTNEMECNAKLECSRGQEHSADLKVDLRGDQKMQLTVKTPYEGFRLTDLTHSLSRSDSGAQWTGTVTYGSAQQASSQLTLSYPDDRFSSRFDLQTPFTSDLTATFDYQGVPTDFTRKQTLKYGDQFQYADEVQFQINQSPLLALKEVVTYSYGDVSRSHSFSLRSEGPLSDVTVVARGEMDGQVMAVDGAFKNDLGRMEGNLNLHTPFQGFRDVGGSFQHMGEVGSAFSSEAKVQYTDGQELTGKLDFVRASWRRLEVTAELTTPFPDWTQTRAEYRHNADSDGFTCYAGADYLGDQQLTGDLRVTSSPNPEVTLTLKTPWTDWEQLSATGAYSNDGWGKTEVSSKLDLGQGHVYTAQSSLSSSDDSGTSINARLTTPHADWHSVEARVSHKGGVADFQSSAYLSTPLLDAVSASASLRYSSATDLTAAASLDTPFDGLKDWKMEMVNGERGSQKTSHVILSWSGDQEMVMDGTWRHDNSWYERHLHTDISMTSPFQALRSTNWVLEHHATQGTYEQKLSGSLNGDKLADLELSTLTGDLGQVTLTLAEPYAMQYALTCSSEGAELSLDWDRNDPNSNLRLTSRFTDSSDSNGLQHDLDLKITHPSRTVGAKYSLQSSSLTTTSQGELYWGRGSNRRVFYTLDLNDLSRRSSTSYEGKVKVGAWSRAVQVSGAVTHSPLSRQMDATLHWDADRDDNKQVTLKTRWTSGDKNKADLTLSLPSINQEVRVQSEVAVNQGRTLLDSTTALTYSPDSSKVLTFTSTLKDTTGAWESSSSNYTLHLSLTHPHTDLDLSMTSHLGASEDRYSAAVDTWYLTSGRQRKNMALRGEIDQLRRQLTMEMVSPVKKVVMKGEVKSVDPYSLSLTNRYDDDDVIQADVTLDTNTRSFSFRTNYDLDHPEHSLNIKAFYVNDTAIKAEVYRDHVTDIITDALLAFRLNTSTLLHSRLHWRPSSLSDLQAYSVAKLSAYAFHSKQSMQLVNEAVREELAARYSRSAAAVAQDLAPWMDLVHTEMQEVASQLQTLRRQLTRVYRRHPMLQDMGSAAALRYRELMAYVGEMSDSYQQQTEALSQQMKEAVQAMTQLPVGEYYQQSAQALVTAFEELIDRGLKQLTQKVVSLDSYLLAARHGSIRLSNAMTEAVHNVTHHPYVLYLHNSMDLTPYLQAASNKINSLRMPEKYISAIYDASARVNEVMSDVMNMETMKRIKEASNGIYQEGVRARDYWQAEENLHKHLASIATLLEEIVEEELQEYTRHFRFLQKSHVTVWDPEHAEIQAEIHLPLAMETFDSVPDVTPLVTQYNNVMKKVPDMDTVQYFYDHYVPQSAWWADNSTEQGQLMEELDEYTPSPRKTRLLEKKMNFKGRKSVRAM